AAVLRLDRTAAVSGRTSRTLRMGNLAPGIGPFPPVEKGPTSLGFADHPTAPFTLLPRNSQPLLGIARNGCSGSVGTTARDQSVRVLGINWNSCSGSLGAPKSRSLWLRLEAVANSDLLLYTSGAVGRKFGSRQIALKALPVKELYWVRPVGMIHRRERYISPAVRRFIEILTRITSSTAVGAVPVRLRRAARQSEGD